MTRNSTRLVAAGLAGTLALGTMSSSAHAINEWGAAALGFVGGAVLGSALSRPAYPSYSYYPPAYSYPTTTYSYYPSTTYYTTPSYSYYPSTTYYSSPSYAYTPSYSYYSYGPSVAYVPY